MVPQIVLIQTYLAQFGTFNLNSATRAKIEVTQNIGLTLGLSRLGSRIYIEIKSIVTVTLTK